MKFDKYGRRIKTFASVESQNAMGPETMKLLESMGIKRDTIESFISMIPKERADDAMKIIVKLARLQK